MNFPAIQQHRGLVGLPDGSHKNPPVLFFDPSLNTRAAATSTDFKFKYPQSYGVKRPSSNIDLAYMTVSLHSFFAFVVFSFLLKPLC